MTVCLGLTIGNGTTPELTLGDCMSPTCLTFHYGTFRSVVTLELTLLDGMTSEFTLSDNMLILAARITVYTTAKTHVLT